MKRIQFILAICCLTLSAAYAQTNRFNLSAGIGLEPTMLMDNATSNGLPLNFKIGYQFSPLFSLNAFGGHVSSTSQPRLINDGLSLRTTMEQTFIGVRPELKKGLGDRFEVYGGAMVGFVKQTRTETTADGQTYNREEGAPSPYAPNSQDGRMLFSGFVGTNFFPVKNVGLFAELGYGVTLLNAGVTLRL